MKQPVQSNFLKTLLDISIRFCPPYTPLCKHFSEKQNNIDSKIIPLALRLCFTIVGGLCENLKVIFFDLFLMFFPKFELPNSDVTFLSVWPISLCLQLSCLDKKRIMKKQAVYSLKLSLYMSSNGVVTFATSFEPPNK